MLGKRLELELADGTRHTVAYTGVDLRAYEAAFSVSVLTEPMSLTMLTWLAWSAGKRTGVLNGEWDRWGDFNGQCTGVRVLPDEEPPTPTKGKGKPKLTDTQPAATGG